MKVGTPFGEFPFELRRFERRGRGVAAVGTVAGIESSVVIGPEDVSNLAKRVLVPLLVIAFLIVRARSRRS